MKEQKYIDNLYLFSSRLFAFSNKAGVSNIWCFVLKGRLSQNKLQKTATSKIFLLQTVIIDKHQLLKSITSIKDKKEFKTAVKGHFQIKDQESK